MRRGGAGCRPVIWRRQAVGAPDPDAPFNGKKNAPWSIGTTGRCRCDASRRLLGGVLVALELGGAVRATGGVVGDLLLAEGAGARRGRSLLLGLLGETGLLDGHLLEVVEGVHTLDDGEHGDGGDQEADDRGDEGAEVDRLTVEDECHTLDLGVATDRGDERLGSGHGRDRAGRHPGRGA